MTTTTQTDRIADAIVSHLTDEGALDERTEAAHLAMARRAAADAVSAGGTAGIMLRELAARHRVTTIRLSPDHALAIAGPAAGLDPGYFGVSAALTGFLEDAANLDLIHRPPAGIWRAGFITPALAVTAITILPH